MSLSEFFRVEMVFRLRRRWMVLWARGAEGLDEGMGWGEIGPIGGTEQSHDSSQPRTTSSHRPIMTWIRSWLRTGSFLGVLVVFT